MKKNIDWVKSRRSLIDNTMRLFEKDGVRMVCTEAVLYASKEIREEIGKRSKIPSDLYRKMNKPRMLCRGPIMRTQN